MTILQIRLPGPATHLVSSYGRLLRMAALLFVLFGISYAYFTQGGSNYNVFCRAALTANIVQHGRIDINGYETATADKAFYQGNYFCDKAPGMSFLAVPAAFVFTRALPVSGEAAKTPSNPLWHAFVYLCAVSTSGLITAFAAVVLFWYLVERTFDTSAALVGSLAFGLGTPVWGWATSFFGHAAAAAFLMMGFIALDSARRLVAAGERAGIFAALGGLALGAATAVEYTSFVPAAVIGACIAASSPWSSRARSILATFAIASVGAFCALLPVLIYHDLAFGSPFTPGYRYAAVFDALRTDSFGIAIPDFSLIAELLFGARRGLIWISPIMLAAAWAAIAAVRRPQTRMPALAAVLVLAWYLALNSGFSYWTGGFSTGPRYLTPALGMVAIPLGLAWPCFGPWERRVSLVLLAVSIAVNLACAAVGMTAPEDLSNPLTEFVLPNLIDGRLERTLIFKITGRDGLVNLVPLLAISAVIAWLLWREIRRAKLPVAAQAMHD